MKTCSKCGGDRNRVSAKGRVYATCQTCFLQSIALYRAGHREELNRKAQEYYKCHKIEKKAYDKAYNIKNIDRIATATCGLYGRNRILVKDLVTTVVSPGPPPWHCRTSRRTTMKAKDRIKQLEAQLAATVAQVKALQETVLRLADRPERVVYVPFQPVPAASPVPTPGITWTTPIFITPDMQVTCGGTGIFDSKQRIRG